MSPKILFAALLTSTALAAAPFGTADAGGFSHAGGYGGPALCTGGGVTINKPVSVYKPTYINKSVNVYKPVTVNKRINVYKPTTINKNINIYKPVTITKDINITKNINNSKYIDASKSININKTIVINKGGAEASAYASAFAAAMAQAGASASASTNLVIYSGYNEYVTVNNHIHTGGFSAVQTSGMCEMQKASVVKSIHAVCIGPDGRQFPASHMTPDTWIDSSMEGEVLRCIPGAHLKVTIGDVLQSDQGLAGTNSGETIECTENEALRHYKDGMVKCAPKKWVKDCTERTNLRRYGTGDLFFSYRATVCVNTPKQTVRRDVDVTGMSLDGGVGAE